MRFGRSLWLVAGILTCASVAAASGIAFTCNTTTADDPDTYAAGTCAYLNGAIAASYSSIFTDANASIYVSLSSSSPLSENLTSTGTVTYAQYAAALAATAASSGDPIQIAAAASLSGGSPASAAYGKGSVDISTALAGALGIAADFTGGNNGLTSAALPCSPPGSPGCYNGLIAISTPAHVAGATGGADSLYFGTGATPAGDYNFYSLVEQQTDEILGMYSCVATTSAVLKDSCSAATNTPSADDLFRYSAPENLSTVGSAVGSTNGGYAYFSYNGGATNGADGFVYNSAPRGGVFASDPAGGYADFSANCVGGPYSVEDEMACTGTAVNILHDGGAEVNILNAIGYEEPVNVPEPGTLSLLAAGVIAIGAYRRMRRA